MFMQFKRPVHLIENNNTMPSYIQIAEPCHENWNAMTPDDKGRHCALCCKTVVDFASWEPEDIMLYLQENTNTCGRIPAAYVNVPLTTPDDFVTTIHQIPFSRFTKTAAIFLFAFGLLSASCDSPAAQTKQKPPVPTVQVPAPPDNPDIMGGIRVYVPDSVAPPAAHKPPKTEHMILGGVAIAPPPPEPPMLMGEPAVVPQTDVDSVKAIPIPSQTTFPPVPVDNPHDIIMGKSAVHRIEMPKDTTPKRQEGRKK